MILEYLPGPWYRSRQGGFEMKTIIIVSLLLLAGCQVSHAPVTMVNPETGEKKTVSYYGTTGKLNSAIAARKAHEREVEYLKSQGYQEVK